MGISYTGDRPLKKIKKIKPRQNKVCVFDYLDDEQLTAQELLVDDIENESRYDDLSSLL